jgi:L-threonylcarbamoyladenylate synthase
VILRPGGISRERIEAVIGEVDVFQGTVDAKERAASPGQQAVHYSPKARAYRFESHQGEAVGKMIEQEEKAAVMTIHAQGDWRGARVVRLAADAKEYARALYRTLRELDEAGVGAIFIEMPPGGVEWVAVRDRVARATRILGDQSGF